MSELNLGALTSSLQAGFELPSFSQEKQSDSHPSSNNNEVFSEAEEISSEELVSSETVLEAEIQEEESRNSRIELTRENTRKLDILRFAGNETPPSRTQLANEIIAQYLESHSEELALNVKALLETLRG